MSTNSSGGVSGVLDQWMVPLAIWVLPLVTVGLGLQGWLPPLASEHGAGIDFMLRYLLVSVGTMFLIGNAVLGYFVFRFSRASKVTVLRSTWKQERKWLIIPLGVLLVVGEGGVIFLGLPVWAKYYAAAPPADSLVIEVLAEQFVWNIRYPGADGAFGKSRPELYAFDNPTGLDDQDPAAQDDIVTLSRIVLPVNRPVHIRLKSKDVLHSFFLPYQRVKQDAVPGMTIRLWFVPTVTGQYELACAELCGSAHYNMRGIVTVVSEAEFEQWYAEQVPYFAE